MNFSIFLEGYNTGTDHLIADQTGGSYPITDLQGLTLWNGWTMNSWSEETIGVDDDLS